MNLKTELKNLGYYLITPVPQKYHFEGVNNRRAAIQLLVVATLIPVAIAGAAYVVSEIEARKASVRFWNSLEEKTKNLNKK